ncbi:rho guanine nucleotide exchange factor 40 [Bombina bombina]|uniref:rho guanine nucleotide exchange factor 40 n=1 Tax=Bombina bombina TaxID=8345 RepID=UPI00235ADBEC|nr:rho guanine nucleotide exchange factor 40 [Bombina bombina]
MCRSSLSEASGALQYCGLLFRHAGWPLCINEKVVLQLASIDWRLLEPGDFYFQVVPYLRKTPRIVLKCLAHDLHNIEELVVPEVSYTSIFTLEWLEFINLRRMGTSLENCLLTSDDQLFRVPWDRVVNPEFVGKLPTLEQASEVSTSGSNKRQQLHMEDSIIQRKEDKSQIASASSDFQAPEHITLEVKTVESNSEIEGEYVELADISVQRLGPQMGSLTQSIALNFKSHQKNTQWTQNKQTVVIGDSQPSSSWLECSSVNTTPCSLLQSNGNTFMGQSFRHITHFSERTLESSSPDYVGHMVNESGIQDSKSRDPQEHQSLIYSACNQMHSLECKCSMDEDISMISAQIKLDSGTGEANSTQICEQSDLKLSQSSKSFTLLQQKGGNIFIDAIEDVRSATGCLQQQPATDHYSGQDLLIEVLESSQQVLSTGDIGQNVPLSSLDKNICQLEITDRKESENVVGSEEALTKGGKDQDGKSGLSILCSSVSDTSLVAVEHSQSASINNELDTTDTSIIKENAEGVIIESIVRDFEDIRSERRLSTETLVEQDPSKDGKISYKNDHLQNCLPHTEYSVSGSDIVLMPLETLHEDTEEHQRLCEKSTEEQPSHVVTETEQVTYVEKIADNALHSVASVSCQQGLCPSISWRNPGHLLPTLARDVNLEVLMSGIVSLPGTRDRNGRAVVIISTRNTAWLNPNCTSAELGRLFLYFYSIPKKERRALGLTLLVDARRCSPVPALFKAFHIVQAAVPNCIHGVLLLVEKDLVLSGEKLHGVQFDLLTSTKSLHKHIEAPLLPLEFDGSLPYCHKDWLAFRMKWEHLQEACHNAYNFLQNAIRSLHISSLPEKAEEASNLLMRFGQLMKTVLEDKRLVRLQTEGGAILARLRKEESCVTLTEDYREAVDMAAELYNRVDEGVHSLVKLSNKRIQEMELVIEFDAFEEQFCEVGSWIENVGERLLRECTVLEDSLEVLLQTQRRFQEFYVVALEYCRRAQEMMQISEKWQSLSSPEIQKYRVKLQRCKDKLGDFSWRLEEARTRLEKTVVLYQFFDKAYEWALEGMRHLASITLDDCNSPDLCVAAIESLEYYKAQHPEIDEQKFEEMRELACELQNERATKQWKFAWSKCQEARQVFEKKLEAALRVKRSLSMQQRSPGSFSQRRHSDSVDQKMHSEKSSNMSYFQNKLLNSPLCSRDSKLGKVLENRSELGSHCEQKSPKTSPLSNASSMVSAAFRMRKMSLQSVPGEDPNFELLHQEPSCSSTPTAQSRPITRRLLRKAQSFDLPNSEGGTYGCQRRLSEPGRKGNTGVFIKGLEVSSTELVDRPCSPRQPLPLDWSSERILSERRSSISSDGRTRSSKFRHIIDEMVTTEREYVRSLWYITENYFPEMERLDLPQDLRGKRGIIFGNLEKLRDFHSQYFLRELESCCNHPLRVSHCFLRHKDQFGMYALYSKNKPRSDLLLASHGNIFFKNKQCQLGDKMDLASYLLKPIQRMSKYALLLKDLIKECGEAQEQELAYLRAAEEMVKFQLRHGNDLLAMDAIRDCDVNLKEQGQLVRQDEFTVWLGRKKCQRHIFLFEDLILFSKPKRIEGGLAYYIYKRSYKTADIGLTESSGDSGLRFEIWFRRRKSNDTYIIQAAGPETKQAWTSDIAKILWQQANRNKEIRMKEMVSMGVGNKPFLDIKPSDAAINNRAIDYIMKGRGARTRASIAVSLFDHSDPYKRTQAPITCSSVHSKRGPSSASLLGPLNLHMYVNQTLLPGMLSHNRPFETSSCLEEDELENETSSSQPSMTTESSESSQCMSGAGSSGSDSGCVSYNPQDNLSEDAGSPCDGSTAYALQGHRNSSSIISPIAEKPKFINKQYISANTRNISLSPSTIV